jgi:hypothetical protein
MIHGEFKISLFGKTDLPSINYWERLSFRCLKIETMAVMDEKIKYADKVTIINTMLLKCPII